MDSEQIIKDWRDAYAQANGTPAPKVVYENGWFKISSIRMWGSPTPKRKQAMLRMIETLKARLPGEDAKS